MPKVSHACGRKRSSKYPGGYQYQSARRANRPISRPADKESGNWLGAGLIINKENGLKMLARPSREKAQPRYCPFRQRCPTTTSAAPARSQASPWPADCSAAQDQCVKPLSAPRQPVAPPRVRRGAVCTTVDAWIDLVCVSVQG